MPRAALWRKAPSIKLFYSAISQPQLQHIVDSNGEADPLAANSTIRIYDLAGCSRGDEKEITTNSAL